MYVKSVTNGVRQHEFSTPITSIVGKNSPIKDMNEITEWCCVGSVTTHFTENINLKHWRNQNYYGNI
jgi:hypothetical protein